MNVVQIIEVVPLIISLYLAMVLCAFVLFNMIRSEIRNRKKKK